MAPKIEEIDSDDDMPELEEDVSSTADSGAADGEPDLSGMDMAELQKLMASMGGGAGGAGGPPGGAPGGGMDIESMLAGMGGGMGGMGGGGGMMGGMGGPPPDMGEVDGGAGDTKWKWEMKDDEIIVRIALDKPAKKTDLKVVFGSGTLKVEVFGETIIDGKLAGTVHGDESTWCLVEKGSELQILLSAATNDRWPSLLEGSD